MNWSKYSAPQAFYPLAGRLIPWFAVVAVALMGVGLYMGFFVAPTDFQQGESYRIIFVHVPAAWMSMFLYVVMAIWAGVGMGLNARLSFMMAQAIAPTGAMFTFLALLTGAMWGKPTWGAWWVWDARLTSELILLFQYAGVMLLRTSIDDHASRRPVECGLFVGRSRQCADHLFFGTMVEHLASRRLSQHVDGVENGGDHVDGDAHHDGRVLAL